MMNLEQRIAIRHYLEDYPHDWEFDRIVNHLIDGYEFEPEVKPKSLYGTVDGRELNALILRAYRNLANRGSL